MGFWVDDLSSLAFLAALVLGIIVGVVGTGNAGLTIEDRSRIRAVHTFFHFNTIYLVVGATETLFSTKVEIFGEIAFNTI